MNDDPKFASCQSIVLVATADQLTKYGLEFDDESGVIPTKCQVCKADAVMPTLSVAAFLVAPVTRVCFDCIGKFNDLYERKMGKAHAIIMTKINPSICCTKASKIVAEKIMEYKSSRRAKSELN